MRVCGYLLRHEQSRLALKSSVAINWQQLFQYEWGLGAPSWSMMKFLLAGFHSGLAQITT